MATDRVIWEWQDVQSGFLRASNWSSNPTNLGPLQTAVSNASNAVIQYLTSAAPFIGTATPVGGQYQSVEDVALFNFQTIPGTTVQLVVPAPINAVFGANSTIVDPTATLSAAIIAAAIGTLSDAGGNLATAYAGGSKGSRRREQT